MRLLERDPRAGGDGRPQVAPEDQRTDQDARAIRCAACGRPITTSAERIAVQGAHEHTRFNASGLVFRFGCFGAAPGCAVAGPPTDQDTWFSGHLWRYALCAGCGAHLGWSFEGAATPAAVFFGLVLEKLVEDAG